ncbi:MAG: hypothetical protein IT376_04795 [Polyangiaceae bacterium]|nr:hypothetical protein [Polyangiaceae bacterium]
MTTPGSFGPSAHLASHVGRRRVLASCLDDEPDDLEARSFESRVPRDRLPPVVDLRRWLPPVETESDLGGSAASALSCAVEYLVTRGTGRHVDVSRLFVYYNQRLWGRHVREDRGASIRSGIRVLSRLGVPSERAWPYAIDLFAVQPPEGVYVAAARHRIADWAKLPIDLDALRGALAGGLPVVTSVRVGPEFVDLGASGRVPLAAVPAGEGRHAVLLVGYSSADRVFVARNSWGADWGHGGYCYLPFELLLAPGAVGACWVVRTSAGLAFEASEHAAPDLASLPKAPPAGAPASAPAPGALFPPAAFPHATGAGAPAPGALFPASAFPALGASGGAPPAVPPPPTAAPPPAAAPAAPAGLPGAGPGWMSLLGSAAAVVGGTKTPLQLALDLATQHSGGLVAKYTGSDMAGRVVGGLVGQVAPTVAAPGGFSSLSLASLGTAVAGAAFGGGAPQGGPPTPGGQLLPGGPPAPPAVDPGVLLGADLSPRILAILEAATPPTAVARHAWDDGWDEEVVPAAPQARAPAAVAPAAVAPAAVAPPPAAPLAAAPAPSAAGDPATQALAERWRALGGEAGPLGRPTGGERALGGGGRAVVCERGAVVWSRAHGAHDVRTTILETWLRTGAESGPLGYPTAGEARAEHGAATARLGRFERGLVVDWEGSHDLPPFLLLSGDAAFDAWVAAGAERGPAGVPVGAPLDLGTGERILPCAAGAVGWSPTHGTAVLTGEQYAAWRSAIERAAAGRAR